MFDANNSISLSLWIKNDEIWGHFGWLLCCWKQFHQNSCHCPLHPLQKLISPPSPVDQFSLLIFTATNKPISIYGLWFPLVFGDCALGKMAQEVWVLWDILGKNIQIIVNSPCFWWHNTLPVSYLKWRWREGETRFVRIKNGLTYLLGECDFGDLCTYQIIVKMGVFFWKELVSGHLEGQGTLPW